MTWIRSLEGDDGMEWVVPTTSEMTVDRSDNDVVAVLLGPSGEVLSAMLEREPIGYRQRWT